MKLRSDSQIDKQLRSFFAALRFLTIIPVSRGAELDGDYFKPSLLYFPVIGIIIGSCGFVFTNLLQNVLPQGVVVCLIITFLAFISGCLHLDGLSDSGDGLLSSRPKERSMEIMKDSRVGAMGVILTVLVLLTKYSALTAVDSKLLPMAVFFMPFAGRVIILCTMAFLPYAREEGGLGTLFYTRSVRGYALAGSTLFVVILGLTAPPKFLIALVLLLIVFFAFNVWCKSKIGGATGDTLGASCELAETVIAIAFSTSFFVTI